MRANRWEDHYARRSRQEKWLARSVYKLEEIDKKFRLIQTGYRLLDLGCYPGSWSQYGIKRVGAKGEVVGIDLVRPKGLSSLNFRFLQSDVHELDPKWLLEEVGPMDLVLSDMAPRTTGVSTTDTVRSMSLARRAALITMEVLKKNKHFVCKIFEGDELKDFKSELSSQFRQIRLLRPGATRKRSREVYLVGLSRY